MLNKRIAIALALSILPSSLVIAETPTQTEYLLLDNYTVYVKDYTVVNYPAPGFEPRTLPSNNDDLANPGCYVACYSHDSTNSAYSVSENIHVHGQVRISGMYEGRICKPFGYEQSEISNEAFFNQLCDTKVVSCKGKECWAGGDTGGWFGIK